MCDAEECPVLYAEGETLAEAWEESLLALHESSGRVPTEYDLAKEEESLDAEMLMVVRNPLVS